MDKSEGAVAKGADKSDDESITTSTESESFDTWTLVTDKKNAAATKTKEAVVRDIIGKVSENLNDAVEDLETSDCEDAKDTGEEQEQPRCEGDDLSDGISIISESESGGRISPQPEVNEHNEHKEVLPTTKPTFTEMRMPLPDMSESLPPFRTATILTARRQVRPRDHIDEFIDDFTRDMVTPVSDPVPFFTRKRIKRVLWDEWHSIYLIWPLACVLCFGATVWYYHNAEVHDHKRYFENKLNEAELFNNLMRAEIDIIAKQLKYISEYIGLDEQAGAATGKRYAASGKDKTFKAWAGNGKGAAPVDITKEDLKRAHQCTHGVYDELLGSCLEKTPEGSETLIFDEIGNVVSEVLQQTEALKQTLQSVNAEQDEKVEVVDDEIHGERPTQYHRNKHNDKSAVRQPNSAEKKSYHKEDKYQKRVKPAAAENYAVNSKERVTQNGKYEHKYEQKYHKQPYRHNDHDDDDDDSDEDFDDDDDDHHHKHHAHRNDDDDSHEEDDSKERFTGKQRKFNSKERFNKSDTKRDNSKERHKMAATDGHWHEKLMQQREYARRQNEEQQKRAANKNWYIERGDSREQIRHR